MSHFLHEMCHHGNELIPLSIKSSPKAETGTIAAAGTSTLAMSAFLIAMLAMYPAWMSYSKGTAGPGAWDDNDFFDMLASIVLQTFGLGVQVLGPVLLPKLFPLQLGLESQILIWVLTGSIVLLSAASAIIYGLASSSWSGLLNFAAQAVLLFVQLILVFGG